jgi:hypothetical protein
VPPGVSKNLLTGKLTASRAEAEIKLKEVEANLILAPQ